MQKKFFWLLLLFLGLPSPEAASRGICGTPPPEQFREENNEAIKRDLEGKANFLSSFVGKAELGGKIESTRKEIFAKYSDANVAYMDRYLAYMFCFVLFDPKKTQTPTDKEKAIKAIQEFSRQRQPYFTAALSKPPDIPQFPWPPPQASTSTRIPRRYLVSSSPERPLLLHVDRQLTIALDTAGYSDRSYYRVPSGFAMVTRLEQIYHNGTPHLQRWATEVEPLSVFSFEAYLRALFTANPGYFRIIVFVLSPVPFTQADVKVSREESMAWLSKGTNKLPDELGQQEFTDRHVCTALVYEFEKPGPQQEATITTPGRLTAKEHLESSKVWRALGQ